MRLDLTDLLPVRDARLTGDLRSWRDVDLPELGRSAEVYVWLPPGYDEGDDRYPVLYLHDGHNMFLPQRASGGVAWDVDRAMSALARDGIPAVVVAVPCHPTQRGEEYTPYGDPRLGGGRAADYATFLADHLKPAVDEVLRTLPGPEHTLTLGSSLGGLVSAYLWTTRPEVFGAAGMLSPAYYWPTEELGERCLRDLERALASGPPPGRVYLDVGGREHHPDRHVEELYVEHAERLLGALRSAGVPVRYTYDSQGYHFETAWAERFPAAAAWLLRGYAVAPPPSVQADLAAAASSAEQHG
ncbi:alpha/beta hydrolase [Ornithinimicrobium avium]|uniref:Alpha/beta hydrolase n=1 Tax=Ornithinimicrobium avium TaxID=2283195 RepID=A0A345NIR2_9MICO|nr:alpha/beta hydrolase-fold protein [Ornithinimicrobium avium]AXH94920.1 alpha/beta hydrolase [Ornithinimicrobium avium]